jgi:hypothetical protein
VVVDRIERHDVVNAVMLAVALLVLGFAIVTAVDGLFDTMDEGLVSSSKEPEIESGEGPAGASAVPGSEAGGAPDGTGGEPVTEEGARPAADVVVRVANGARRPGVAGAGTEALQAAGYATLPPKNGPTTTDSTVFYGDGYAADAARIAGLLGVAAERVQPMPEDPGVPIDDAHVIVVLGVTSDF